MAANIYAPYEKNKFFATKIRDKHQEISKKSKLIA
jgi:hypothetical protein